MRHRAAVLASVLIIALGLALAACDSNGYGSSSTKAQPTAASTTAPTAAPTTTGANEDGADPIFYRTADNFQTVTAGTPYKIVFRITGGFAEPSLAVTAAREDGSDPQTFTGTKVDAVEGDAPGSYYPVNVTLPQPGGWVLTVTAGADSTTVPINVAQPGPVAG